MAERRDISLLRFAIPASLAILPGMLGLVLLVAVVSGPALGSWIAALPLVLLVVIFVRRTRIEDAMLVRELDGYADYARRVRWRVIPGVY